MTKTASPTEMDSAAPRAGTPLTASPDPSYMASGAGTAAQQTSRPPQRADHANGGYKNKATLGTAGTPGTWTAGSAAPYNLADCAGVTATPGSAWTVGQYCACADNSHVHWDGTKWAAGNGTAAAGGER